MHKESQMHHKLLALGIGLAACSGPLPLPSSDEVRQEYKRITCSPNYVLPGTFQHLPSESIGGIDVLASKQPNDEFNARVVNRGSKDNTNASSSINIRRFEYEFPLPADCLDGHAPLGLAVWDPKNRDVICIANTNVPQAHSCYHFIIDLDAITTSQADWSKAIQRQYPGAIPANFTKPLLELNYGIQCIGEKKPYKITFPYATIHLDKTRKDAPRGINYLAGVQQTIFADKPNMAPPRCSRLTTNTFDKRKKGSQE